MELDPSQPSGAARRWYARDRYPNRPLFWSLTGQETGCPQQFLATTWARGICLSSSRPLQLGRGLLLQLPGPEPGCTTTLFARVASVAPRPDGSWLLRCNLATLPQREWDTRTVA
jgi:hypothetical protein